MTILFYFFFFIFTQTIRVWIVANKECKCDFHDHEHVIEDINWAPESAHHVINEAAGMEVSTSIMYIYSNYA